MNVSRGIVKLRWSSFVLCLVAVAVVVHLLAPPMRSCPSARKAPSAWGVTCLEEAACIPPMRRFDSKFRTASRHNLGACVIEKSMSTLLAALMCLLHDPEAFRSANRSLTGDLWENRFCKGKNEFKTVRQLLNGTGSVRLPDWTLFTVVRDPVERFLSGFVDKCILETKRNLSPTKCYGCERNMTCFLEEEFNRARKFASGTAVRWTYEDIHFFPQNWHCEFQMYWSKYRVLRYRAWPEAARVSMMAEIVAILKEAGVPADLAREVESELNGVARTDHATVDSPERTFFRLQLQKDPVALDFLVRLYYFDFALFGFPLPEPMS